MSQAPLGDIFLLVENDTIIRGVFTKFKNATINLRRLEDFENKEGQFRIKIFQIVPGLIEPLEKTIKEFSE